MDSDNCWRTPPRLTCAPMVMYAAERAGCHNCGDVAGVIGGAGVVERGIGTQGSKKLKIGDW